jgi:hypothetical protein
MAARQMAIDGCMRTRTTKASNMKSSALSRKFRTYKLSLLRAEKIEKSDDSRVRGHLVP